jgi:hypothetical protein
MFTIRGPAGSELLTPGWDYEYLELLFMRIDVLSLHDAFNPIHVSDRSCLPVTFCNEAAQGRALRSVFSISGFQATPASSRSRPDLSLRDEDARLKRGQKGRAEKFVATCGVTIDLEMPQRFTSNDNESLKDI